MTQDTTEMLIKEAWQQSFVTTDMKKLFVESFLCVLSRNQSIVSVYPINSDLKREGRAMYYFHPSDFILSNPGLFLNLRSKKRQSLFWYQSRKVVWCNMLQHENSFSAPGELRPHQASAKREAHFLASLKT